MCNCVKQQCCFRALRANHNNITVSWQTIQTRSLLCMTCLCVYVCKSVTSMRLCYIPLRSIISALDDLCNPGLWPFQSLAFRSGIPRLICCLFLCATYVKCQVQGSVSATAHTHTHTHAAVCGLIKIIVLMFDLITECVFHCEISGW